MNPWRRALAPAKLNLRLEVLGKRDDGFHELVTDMLAIDLVDEVAARRAAGDGVALTVSGPADDGAVPTDDANLATRAARLVQAEARARGATDVGLELTLVKRIPNAAGLGGASSDAAAAVLAADAALDARLDRAWMGDALASLGSDCRFFLDAKDGFARCTGRGERVAPAAPPAHCAWFALAVPAARCPTPRVFAALRLPPPPLGPAAPLDSGTPRSVWDASLGNHLQDAAFDAAADFAPWRALLGAGGEGAPWRVSGSGSSLFRPCATKSEAEDALARLRASAAARDLALRHSGIARAFRRGAHLAV